MLKYKKYKEFKKPKLSYICEKHHFYLVFVTRVELKINKYLKMKNQLKYFKSLSLINSIEEYQKIYNHVSRKYKSRI